MSARFVIQWIIGHFVALGAIGLFTMTMPAISGGALFFTPVILGVVQAWLLRGHIRPIAWPIASLAGLYLSFLFSWFMFIAVGFTVSLAQAFCFKKPPRFVRLTWILCGGFGWLGGLMLAGKLHITDFAMTCFIVLVYSSVMLAPVAMLRRHAAGPAPAGHAD